MSDVVKVSWSGGKDSTCAVMLHIERGDKVKAVCYIPMFTEEIPLISKNHYEFILNTAERFRSLGAEVHIVSGMTYWDFCHKRSSRGKYKGRPFGFPCVCAGKCGFQRESKTKAVKSFDVGNFDYQDIGIAADEVRRKKQLTTNLRSILVEMEYTEKMAWDFCIERNLLSPHYKHAHRDGCALCPNAKKQERNRWFSDFSEAVPLVIELQEFVRKELPGRYPLRNHEWFIDTDQVTFFDEESEEWNNDAR